MTAESPALPRGGAALAWILGGALALHLALVPLPGYERDIYWFGEWTRTALASGVSQVSAKVWCDYPPGYLYVCKAAGFLWRAVTGGGLPADGTLAMRLLVKLPPILADIAGAFLLWRIARTRLGRRGSLAVAAAYAWNPGMVFVSAVWGQADSVVALALLLSAWALLSRRTGTGFALLAIAILMKFQVVVLLPVFLLWAILVQGGDGVRAAYRGTAIAGFAALLPFYWAGRASSVVETAFGAVGRYPFISMNAHNVWWLLGRERSPGISDAMRFGNGLWSYHALGFALLGVFTLLVLGRMVLDLRSSRVEPARALFEASALQVMAFYLFPTQMHERYIVPALVLLAAACIFRPAAWLAYVPASVAVCLSLATTQLATYPRGLGPLGKVFPAGREDALAWSVVFLLLFLALLLGTPSRRFVAFAPIVLALFATVVGASALAPARGTVRLCDREPVAARQDWGRWRRDRTVDDHRLSVVGFLFRHGIGTHASSRMTWHLGKRFRTFDTSWGVDDEANRGQRIQFRILADDRVIYTSAVVSGYLWPGHARVDVTGAEYLTLEVLDGGDGNHSDHADWLQPVLIR